MSLETNLVNLATRMSTEDKRLRTLINGNAADLSGLNTESKNNLQAAINEVLAMVQALIGDSGSSDVQSLDDLIDVVISNPAVGHILRHDGTDWDNVLGSTYFDPAGSAAAAQAASQPADPDLEAIAGIATTPFGRSLLTLASAAALTAALDLATDSVPGIVELATTSEAVGGSDPSRAVTPAGLQAFLTDFIGAAPTDLNEWAEVVQRIVDGESDLASLMTAVNGKQAADPTLSALAAVVTAPNQLIYATSADTFAVTALTAYARDLLGATTAAVARETLEVYSKTEIGNPERDLVAVYEAGLV